MTLHDALALPAGRELDGIIASRVFAMNVVGITTCVNVEGAWSIHPDTDPDDWSCFAEPAPVYLDNCFCDGKEPENDFDKRNHIFGHDTSCLEVVPHYSTSIEAAWQVVEKMRAEWPVCEIRTEKHYCCVQFFQPSYQLDFIAKTAAEAICKAALRCCWKDT